MGSQCHVQRRSLTMQLNSMPVRRIELFTKVCTDTFRTVIRGYKKPLKFQDLYELPHDETCHSLVDKHETDYYLEPEDEYDR